MYRNLSEISSKKIIGVSGPMLAGKDTLVNYIVETLTLHHNIAVTHLHFSDPLRQIILSIKGEDSRLSYHKLTLLLKEYFGKDVLTKLISNETLNSKDDLIIWNGVRSEPDVLALRCFKNNILIYIDASIDDLYARLLLRARNSGDKNKFKEELKEDLSRSTETHLSKIKKKADFIIENKDDELEKTKREFYKVIINEFLKIKT